MPASQVGTNSSPEQVDTSSAETTPQPTLNGRTWVTLRQFAKAVGVSYQTVMRYKKYKAIDPDEVFHVGGQVRVTVKELFRFMQFGNSEKWKNPRDRPEHEHDPTSEPISDEAPYDE